LGVNKLQKLFGSTSQTSVQFWKQPWEVLPNVRSVLKTTVGATPKRPFSFENNRGSYSQTSVQFWKRPWEVLPNVRSVLKTTVGGTPKRPFTFENNRGRYSQTVKTFL